MRLPRARLIFTAGTIVLLAVAGGALALGALAIARAWLFAFVCISMVPLGSVALLLAHGVTGGRWGRALRPVLEPAARATILLIPLSLPVLIAHEAIFPWPAHGVLGDVARLYANGPFFALRMLAGLAIWSLLAWSGAWRRPLFAAIGLSLHLLCLTFLPADWILSVQEHSSSASFGLGFGVEQILAALGFVALRAPQSRDEQASTDLAGMILAALLGTVYFGYVQFVITWYGNLPEKVAWFVTRASDTWPLIVGLAFLCGAVVPFLACLAPAIRHSRARMRFVGAFIVIGVALHIVWLLIPTLGLNALWVAILPTGLLATAVAAIAPQLSRRVRHAQG